ncbi:hypothetical protein Dsin_016298 [Dipteronia sinensis]|uniref:Myb/SANT-like domain-containing protein n=1 Tax=Dipteronia sinensis TaxID=43782 RepID=A0AAE0AE30_9ROSI|nr:hypothetical protein Dsin_016298 [Dipteronia sinensis]
MDDHRIDALYTQHAQGNRGDGNFTSKTYENIVLELREKLGVDIDKDKVKNSIKSPKTNFSECYELFNKGGLSGFAWNPKTKIWSAEPEVWENLLEANHSAKKWQHTPIGNHEKLVDLFVKDRATGAGAETAKEKRKRWDNGSGDNYETVEGIDQLLSQNEVTLESFDRMDDYIDTMVSPAIKEGNSTFEKSQPQVYSEQELWNDLQAMGFAQSILTDAYLYLIENPDKRMAFFGCPLEGRKDLLEMMIYGNGNR